MRDAALTARPIALEPRLTGLGWGMNPGTPDSGTPRQIFYATVSGLVVSFTLVTPLPEEQIPSTFCGERSFPSADKAEEAAHDFNNGFFSVSDGTPGYSLRISMRSGRFALYKQGGTPRRMGP